MTSRLLTSPPHRLLPLLPQEEVGDELHHALGCVEGHEGDQSVRVRFRLTDAAQAGNARGLQRWVPAGACKQLPAYATRPPCRLH